MYEGGLTQTTMVFCCYGQALFARVANDRSKNMLFLKRMLHKDGRMEGLKD
jgi:hypothetical protein